MNKYMNSTKINFQKIKSAPEAPAEESEPTPEPAPPSPPLNFNQYLNYQITAYKSTKSSAWS